ncbi:unnamed protein product, partial [Prorocentrum cordatum]
MRCRGERQAELARARDALLDLRFASDAELATRRCELEAAEHREAALSPRWAADARDEAARQELLRAELRGGADSPPEETALRGEVDELLAEHAQAAWASPEGGRLRYPTARAVRAQAARSAADATERAEDPRHPTPGSPGPLSGGSCGRRQKSGSGTGGPPEKGGPNHFLAPQCGTFRDAPPVCLNTFPPKHWAFSCPGAVFPPRQMYA